MSDILTLEVGGFVRGGVGWGGNEGVGGCVRRVYIYFGVVARMRKLPKSQYAVAPNIHNISSNKNIDLAKTTKTAVFYNTFRPKNAKFVIFVIVGRQWIILLTVKPRIFRNFDQFLDFSAAYSGLGVVKYQPKDWWNSWKLGQLL